VPHFSLVLPEVGILNNVRQWTAEKEFSLMALIRVPKPPKSAYDPNRPVSSLLKSQIDHLREAESKLPLRYRSEVYVKAVRTEGEAAKYIREVTEAIHEAHEEAQRRRRAPKRKRMIEIAAVADERAEREQERARKRRATKRKKSASVKRRKK
jgi:hypothetical protein